MSHLRLTSWQLAPSSAVRVDGAVLSSTAFDANATSWMTAVAPHGGVTVLAALTQFGSVVAPLFGDNLRSVTAEWGERFAEPWWYRTSVSLPPAGAGTYATLLLDGINYRANVWLNGRRIADNRSIVGAYRTFELRPSDQTAWAWGARNTIALECFRQHDVLNDPDSHDLGISFLDWAQGLDHGQAPDGSLGVWRKAAVRVGGAVTLQAPQLSTRLTSDGGAVLTLLVELTNDASAAVDGSLQAQLAEPALASFSAAATVPAGGRLMLSVNTTIARASEALLWWPRQMGEPTLQTLSLSFTPHVHTRTDDADADADADSRDGEGEGGGDGVFGGGAAATAAAATAAATTTTTAAAATTTAATTATATLSVRVGLREVSGGLDARGNFLLRVNGRRLLVRGGGWSPDLLLRMSDARHRLSLMLAQHARLNAIRFEGKLQDDALFDRMDEMGLLALPGLPCCDAWQQWAGWTAEEHSVASASLADQLRRLRRHPSLAAFVLSSDELPPPAVEADFRRVAAEAQIDVPLIAAASWRHSTISGGTGVKMAGPYAWVPPSFWGDARARTPEQGGAWGFATEISPGTSPLTLASAVAAAPGALAWPLNFSARHTAEAPFEQGMASFRAALAERYGEVRSSRAFFALGQLAALEAHRAMFEAYSRHKYEATGLVQWMLSAPYLSNSWHLFDHRLSAGGALYGVRAACAPLAAQYDATDGTLAVVSSVYAELRNVSVSAEVYDLRGNLVSSSQATLGTLAPDSVVHGALPPPKLLPSEPTLLRLRASAADAVDAADAANTASAANAAGAAGGMFLNEYVLPPRPDAVNFTAGCGNAGCAAVEFADLRAVTRLPRVALVASASFAPIAGGGTAVTATVEAAADAAAVALGVELKLLQTDPRTLQTAEVLPALWDSNYFSLLPGERRTVTATLPLLTLGGAGSGGGEGGGGGGGGGGRGGGGGGGGGEDADGGDEPLLVVESLNAALGSLP